MPKPDIFNESSESFRNYKERLDAYIVANDVTDAKTSSLLLSSIGPKTYQTLRSLCAPDLPSSKPYNELCDLLIQHFSPVPLEIMERYKFHKRDQHPSENISQYIANIKSLSEHCNFNDNLLTALRDRFVCGLRDQTIQKRLLQEKSLTFETATNLALAMETATKDAAEIHGNVGTENVHVIKKAAHQYPKQKYNNPQTRNNLPKLSPCLSCGKSNHKRADCFFKDATCNSCGKVGHIKSACRSKDSNKKGFQQRKTGPNKLHSMEQDEFGLEFFNISDGTSKFTTTVFIDENEVKMEIDTGSALSIITKSDFIQKFKCLPKLQETGIKLKTYTGEIIVPLGFINVNVATSPAGKTEKLRLFILDKGSNPILGREWITSLKLDWQEIKQLSTAKPSRDQFLSEFPELFSPGIGVVKGIKASLKLKDNSSPKFFKARPAPYALKPKIEKELKNLEEQGILTKVKSSQWATPIVPVVKKSGDIRICGDFKVTLNPALEAEQYSLPRMEDMMANLGNGEKFSKIDLRQAYHQLQLDESSKQLTVINTHKGLYAYTRLVFGITSAPAIWQRTMDQILQDLPAQWNQDDIIVTGKDDTEHMKNLRAVLQRLQDHGLRANIDKCSFFQKEVVFCGIKISSEGLHKTDDKIQAVLNAPIPEDKSQLRSFLGMVNYYHKWLNNVAQIAKPLYDLLQNNVHFKWTDQCTTAFQAIKKMIASDEVLIKYDPDLPITLSSDASPYGIGTVLSHITDNGDERPIAYASRTLSKAEQKYSQLDKEALAIIWSVRKFYNYLCGRKFTLITDHKPLQYIFDPKKGIPVMSLARQQRYAIFLSGFNYTIQYRNSKANANADSLSRLPIKQSEIPQDEEETDILYTEILSSLPISTHTVAKESRSDPIISKVMHYVKTDNWPNNITPELKPFASKQHELSVQQDCLLWGYRVIPPTKLRRAILSTLHTGHLGVVKMKSLARNYFWWQSLDKNIEAITKECEGCANSQPDPTPAPLHPWHWPSQPWSRLHIDYAGPFMDHMFLVVVDAHTKWLEVVPTLNATSTTTINILSSLFARFGLCQQLVSDNGPQFTSDEFRSFTKSNGIKHTFSAPYHPATNGLAERAVKTFKNAMKAAKNDKGNLYTKLARFLFAYRNAPHCTTNESPAFLMFGRTLRSHLDILRPNVESTVVNKQQSQVNSSSQASLRLFKVGDPVLVRDYRQGQQWKRGTIYATTGPLMYQVEISPNVIWRRHANQIVHTNTQPKTLSNQMAEPDLQVPVKHPSIPIPECSPSAPVVPISTDSTNSGLLGNSPRPLVELQRSPPKQSQSDSLAPPANQVHSPTPKTYTTRSGRVVKKPTKYS